jgi:hypothetical protein
VRANVRWCDPLCRDERRSGYVTFRIEAIQQSRRPPHWMDIVVLKDVRQNGGATTV